VPLGRLLGCGPLVEFLEKTQSPAAGLVVQAWHRGTFTFEHPSSGHGMQLEEVTEEAGLFAGEDEPVRLAGPQARRLFQQLLPGGGGIRQEIRAVEEQLHVQHAWYAVEAVVYARQLERQG
jgi:hypothetical protein